MAHEKQVITAEKTGTVKWFDLKKGYGYITDSEGNDYFVHHTDIRDGRTFIGLKDGDEITFDVVEGRKGEQAGNVVLSKSDN